jgi:isopenicillin-N epimerase
VRPYSADSPWDLDPSILYLTHGTYGACPRPVLEAQRAMLQELEANPIQFLTRDLEERWDAARRSIADFLNADPEGLVGVPNATTGVATVLASLRVRPGDELLTDDHEYNATLNALQTTAERARAQVVRVSIPLPIRHPEEVVEAFLAGVTPRTRLALVSHVTSPSGLVLPIADIVRELDRLGVDTLVDAAHAPGMLEVQLDTLAADYWVGNFHKWCCSPRGAAALYAAPEHRESLVPLVTSVGAPAGFPASFSWLGTDDYTPYLCVPTAIAFLEELGWERLRSHNRALARLAEELVRTALGVEPAVHERFFDSMALVALPVGVGATAESAGRLWSLVADELRAEVAVVAISDRGYLRLSAQAYNAPDEFEQLAADLPAFMARQAGGSSGAAS